MADFVYSRVSTDMQTVAGQLQDLRRRYPDAEVVAETASGAKSRPALQGLLARLRPGDRLVVAALDRLGRRCSEVLALIEDLQRRGVTLISVREGVDYSTPAGRLVTQIMVSVAELERSLCAERTRASLKAAKSRGIKLGRVKSLPDSVVQEALQMLQDGASLREAAKATGVSRAHLHTLSKKVPA